MLEARSPRSLAVGVCQTSRTNLEDILREGMKSGAEVEQGERLPFVMFSRTKPQVGVGRVVYLQVEIDETDPQLRPINFDWFEYHGDVSVSAIKAVANPPEGTEELIALVQTHGMTEYQNAFKFIEWIES